LHLLNSKKNANTFRYTNKKMWWEEIHTSTKGKNTISSVEKPGEGGENRRPGEKKEKKHEDTDPEGVGLLCTAGS